MSDRDNDSEVEELRRQNVVLQSKLQTALATGTSGMCDDLKVEFCRLIQSHRGALSMSAPQETDDFSDEMGSMCLQNIHKALTKANGNGTGTGTGAGASRASTAGRGGGTAAEQEHAQHEHIQQLQDELRNALKAGDDIKLLKAKLESLVERARKDKERYLSAKSEAEFARKKMDMLRDHLEKLMTHLKHEATAKVRVQEQLRIQERELFQVAEQKATIQRKSNAKDRLVLELREGSKILEDQLRLMDEKYLELRVKLDWARENGDKKVRAAQAKAKELRVKFAMMSGGSTSLDKLTLPPMSASLASQSQAGSGLGMDPASLSLIEAGGGGGGGGSYAELQQGGGFESVVFAPGTAGGAGGPGGGSMSSRRSKGGSKGGSKMHGSVDSLGSSGPPTMDKVMEKIRRHAGGKTEWTEDQLRELTQSR